MTMLRRLAPAVLLALAFVAALPPANAAGRSYEGMWWNREEPGRGVSLTHQGGTIFAVWLIYGPDGKPYWVVGVLTQAGESPTFAGMVYATTGTSYAAPPFDPTATREQVVGTATAVFDGANKLTLTSQINGVTGIYALERQTIAAVDLTGVYYGSLKDDNSFSQAQISVGTAPDGTFIMEQRVGFSDVCQFTGQYRQRGSRYEASGTFECTDSSNGTWEIEDLTLVDSVFLVGAVRLSRDGGVETREILARRTDDANTGTGFSRFSGEYRNGSVNLVWSGGVFCTPPPNTEIWRATTDNVSGAERVAFIMGIFYDDRAVAGGTTYYYWLRAKCGSSTGAFYPPSGGLRVVVP